MKRSRSVAHHVALALLVVVAACSEATAPVAPVTPLGTPRPEAALVNTAALTGQLVIEGSKPIAIEAPLSVRAPSPVGTSAAALEPIVMKLQATVSPPVVAGQTLEATDVAFNTDKGQEQYAYVAYSKRGDATLGALDVINIKDREQPRLVQRVTFTDTDLIALAASDDRLFLVGSTSAAGFTERAVMEVVALEKNDLLPTTYSSLRIQLPSYVGTSVHIQNNRAWVTSGTGGPNTGGVTVFDVTSLERLSTIVMTDARAVSGDPSAGTLVVTQGTPGRTSVLNQSTNTVIGAALATGGATVAEARGDVAVDGNWAFVAASNGGTKVMRVDGAGGAIRGTGIDAPVLVGLDTLLSTVNGVAIGDAKSGAWVFTANGEAGIFGYFSTHPSTSSSGTPTFTQLGRLAFPSSISANFIRIDRKVNSMFVASGLGGLRIVKIDN